MSVDEIHIPIGVGDHLLKQMLSRSRSGRKITFGVDGQKTFDGIFVTMEDSERDAHIRVAISLQDLEHISYVLDNMECQLNDYLEECLR